MANHILLQRIELNASAASVTFANIPGTGYTDLKIVASARSTRAGETDTLYLKLNGSVLYGSERRIYAYASTAASDAFSSGGGLDISPVSGNTATANTFSNGEVYIPNYAASVNHSVSFDMVAENNAASGNMIVLGAGLWSNAVPITSITLACDVGNFMPYSTFSLYALAAVGTTPAIAPKASGGNVIAYDGTYWYHTFLSTGTFTPQLGLSAQILVAGAGGGGGGNIGGGGGAGAMTTFATTSTLSSGVGYICTVGAGAAGGVASADGAQGNTSSFAGSGFTTITALGGGKGPQSGNGFTGGSGSGAAPGGTVVGAASGPNTNVGGTAYISYPIYSGGGGGGATGVGGNGTSAPVGGSGGVGYSTTTLGLNALTEFSGMSAICAGGGGSGLELTSSGNAQSGGTSTGGGNGGFSTTNATSATSYGSGGGGGTWTNYASGNGGAGFQGIVIVRYLAA